MTVSRSGPVRTATPRGGAEDVELLKAARAGDRECWELLVDEHLGSMWAAARSAGMPAETADAACRLVWLRLGSGLWDELPLTGEHLDRWLRDVVVAECVRLERTRSWSRMAAAAATGGTGEVSL